MKRSSLKKTPLKANNSLKKGGYINKQSQTYIDKKPERIDRGNRIMACFDRVRKDRMMYAYNMQEVWLSEESKTVIYELKTTNLHHLLLKSVLPEYEDKDWNIMILTEEEHQLAHSNIDKVPEVKRRTEELKQKHLNGEL